MDSVIINISGNWGHFKKPETNNNPLSHDFITKTALIGMIGAVLGKSRNEMKELFPILSEDLLYSLEFVNPMIKISWGFTFRRASELTEKAPKALEFLKNPNWNILLVLKNRRSQEIFEEFITSITEHKSIFTPVLGLHNCPANLELLSRGQVIGKSGHFNTSGIIPSKVTEFELQLVQHYGFDRVPTFQNNDFWNDPAKYVEVIYPAPKFGNRSGIGEKDSSEYSLDKKSTLIPCQGDYYEYTHDNSQWCLL